MKGNYYKAPKPNTVHSDITHRAFPGPCTAETVRCGSANEFNTKTNSCCRSHIIKIVSVFAELAEQEGIPWIIDYGTLLGYMVNRGIYWNDKDADLSVLATHREATLGLRERLEQHGFYVTYAMPRDEQWVGGDRMKIRLSRINHTNCDIFFWEQRGDGILFRNNYISVDKYKGREFPASWFSPTKLDLWEGIPVRIPARADLLVAHRYSRDWNRLEEVNPGKRRLDVKIPDGAWKRLER